MAFIYEVVSKYDIQETVGKVKAALKGNGFGTLFELNFKDKFAEHNIAYEDDFYVLEVCNPGQAKKILDISTNVGYFLPCKVVVYVKDSIVKVGMLKPTSMIHMIIENKEANVIAKEVEEVIILSIDNALN